MGKKRKRVETDIPWKTEEDFREWLQQYPDPKPWWIKNSLTREKFRAHLSRVKAAREGYDLYLGIAKILFSQGGEAVAHEQERFKTDEDKAWPDEYMGSNIFIPQPEIPRELLQNIINVSRFLLDQGLHFERYHRGLTEDGCIECGKRLPRGKRKYCSRRCTNLYLQRRHRAQKLKTQAESGKYRVTASGREALVLLYPEQVEEKEEKTKRKKPTRKV